MNHFINEYRITSDVMKESFAVLYRQKFKKITITVLICMVAILLYSIATGKLEMLILEVLLISILVMQKLKVKQAIKTEKDRVKVIYPDGPPVIHVEIGENVTLQIKENNRNIAFSDIEIVAETKSLIVLGIRGMMTVVLRKDSFREGTAEECLAYLHERTGK